MTDEPITEEDLAAWEREAELESRFTGECIVELITEIRALRDALQMAVGHSNCYCYRCKAISEAYFSPTKAMEEKP